MALPTMAAPGSGIHFLDLPAELRLEIYEHVFRDTNGFDLLMNKRGPNLALRQTCRFIYHEAHDTYEKHVAKHVPAREELVEHLITKYELAVSPHRSIVFWPPICRSATQLRTVNSLCLHECAKDRCYMCEDKAHRHCFDCGRNVAAALWCYDNPQDVPALVVKGSSGMQLTEFGSFIERVRPVAYRRIQNRVDRSKIDRYWQRELDVQRAIDYRCELRRTMVDEFWSNPQAQRADFTERTILELEQSHSGMCEYKRIARNFGDGFLDWEVEYGSRVAHRVRCADERGITLPPQVPTKEDAEKIKTLQNRFSRTTHIGRWNNRIRGGRVENRSKPPLHERRIQQRRKDALAHGVPIPSLTLAGGLPPPSFESQTV